MSFPRYPKYKASGVEWLGEVPEHWEVKPLKTIAQGGNALFVDGDWIESKDISSQGIRYLTSGNVGEGFYKEQGSGFITDNTFRNLNCIEVLPGDILISRLNHPIGRACIVPDLGSKIVTCVDNVIVRPAERFNTTFCVYLLSCKSHFDNMGNLGRGATMPRISRSALGRIQFAFPPLSEQRAIASFLDRETAKLDGLVAEQRRLIELLKEKRQAVISHAVTKGLHPNAPTKPSGIEWLGDVPAHWEVWKLTHAFEKIGSGTTPKTDNREYYEDGLHPWVNTGDLNDGELCDCEKRITDLALSDHTTLRVYPAGSVVIAMYGATIGKLAILQFPASVNQACCVFSGKLKIEYKFLFYWLLAYRPQIISLASGGGQPNINQDILRGLRVACPTLREQTAIAQFLDRELARFDALTAEAPRAIELLQERRTALISSAVTGQIDVRRQPRD